MQTVQYRYVRRNAEVGGQNNDVERCLNKFASFGYKVVGQSVIGEKIYFTLERPLTAEEIKLRVEQNAESEAPIVDVL